MATAFDAEADSIPRQEGRTPMKVKILLLILCYFFLNIAIVTAADLRGRVDGMGPYAAAPFPLTNATIELKRQGRSNAVVSSYRTGRDGMYYFRNIQPGSYLLVINRSLKVPIQVQRQSLQNIGPILFRY